jgi:RimJ/RimL family protein N-acetyltransferase
MSFQFIPFDEKSLSIYQAWFEDDELRRRISFPDHKWFNYVSHDSSVHCWAVYENIDLIAQIQMDVGQIDDSTAYISLSVDPLRRGEGTGSKVLEEFLHIYGEKYQQIEAGIEPDNLASIKCFEKNDFVKTATEDADGILTFIRISNTISGSELSPSV